MKQADIEQLLPGIFQRTIKPGSPLLALLEVMEELHRPDEAVLTRLDEVFNPLRTRKDFVPLLARWLDLAALLERPGGDQLVSSSTDTFSTGLGRLRELVASAAELSKWTGTARGLQRYLQIATGEPGFEIRENVTRDGAARPFHLAVMAPGTLEPHLDLIKRIIESEKPAYVTYELVIN